MDTLNEYDVIFLLESWTNEKNNIVLNDYVSHNYYRKFQHRNARRSNGGIVLLYKKMLRKRYKSCAKQP